MRFILARHCTTDWNAVGKIQGSANRNLTAKGLEEAQQLAENLKDMGITKIVSSTLNRAMQTAVVVNSVLNVEKDLDVR
ncbi:MAG: histidine phosphatase family protein, partial [Parcubacteria group bacterium]|nr:histidine phosphatase family protein [Parcubacteria group bacterium]